MAARAQDLVGDAPHEHAGESAPVRRHRHEVRVDIANPVEDGARGVRSNFHTARGVGLFVEPSLGPVMANYGLENLRFTKPVYPGDTIHVRLTVKQKTTKDTPADGVPQGVVAWDVEVKNQDDEAVAIYTILTLVRRRAEQSGTQ